MARRKLALVLAAVVAGAASGSSQPAPNAFRGTNGALSFSSARDGNDEIYVAQPDGRDAKNITAAPSSERSPKWSPDGTRVAFFSDREGDYELYVMPGSGGAATRLTTNPEHAPDIRFASTLSWSPDGTRIVYATAHRGRLMLFTVAAGGGTPQRLTEDRFEYQPAWSPDGTKIAYADVDTLDVWIVGTDGTNRVNLTNHPGLDATPAWSPDGTKIAFVSDRDGQTEIYRMNADGSAQERLTNDPGGDLTPTWSPDGTKIAFASNRSGNFDIYVMDAGGGAPTRVTDSPARDFGPDWQRLLADLAVTARARAARGRVGRTIVHEVRVRNLGPSTAQGVEVRITLSAGTRVVAARGCAGPRPLVCELGSIAPGAGATVRLTTKPARAGVLVVRAMAAGTIFDPAAANDTAVSRTRISPR